MVRSAPHRLHKPDVLDSDVEHRQAGVQVDTCLGEALPTTDSLEVERSAAQPPTQRTGGLSDHEDFTSRAELVGRLPEGVGAAGVRVTALPLAATIDAFGDLIQRSGSVRRAILPI